MTDNPFREPPPGTKRHYWSVDPDMTDEEIDALAEHIVDVLTADASKHGFDPGREQPPEG